MADDDVISRADLDKYITEKLLPYITSQYSKTSKVNANLDEFLKDVINAVKNDKEKLQVRHNFSLSPL